MAAEPGASSTGGGRDAQTAAFPRLPERYWLAGTEGSTWDPDVLRARCEAHRSHAIDHKIDGVHPGVVLYLLDVWVAAKEAAEYHASQGVKHIVDVWLKEAVDGTR